MIQCVIITLHYMFYSYAMTNVFDESESMVYLSSGQKNKKKSVDGESVVGEMFWCKVCSISDESAPPGWRQVLL